MINQPHYNIYFLGSLNAEGSKKSVRSGFQFMIQNGPIKFSKCFCNLEVSSGACEVIDGRRFELCCVSADVNFAH